MKVNIQKKLAEAKQNHKQQKKLLKRLKSMNSGVVDSAFQDQHEQVFQQVDCLDCANCCKTTSPMFSTRDIARIAKHLKMKTARFEEEYLQVDEDGDYVLHSTPCPFLLADNYCSIYEVRPKACREYPHTDRKKIQQLFPITEKNLLICPAVFDIINGVKKELGIQ